MQDKQFVIGHALAQQVIQYMITTPSGSYSLGDGSSLVNALQQLKPIEDAPATPPEPPPAIVS